MQVGVNASVVDEITRTLYSPKHLTVFYTDIRRIVLGPTQAAQDFLLQRLAK